MWAHRAHFQILTSLQLLPSDWEMLGRGNRSGTRVEMCVKLVMTTSVVLLLLGPSAVLYLVSGVSQPTPFDESVESRTSTPF